VQGVAPGCALAVALKYLDTGNLSFFTTAAKQRGDRDARRHDYLLFAEQILQKNSYVGTCGRYQLHGTQIHAHA
jgi:hypothetical protein